MRRNDGRAFKVHTGERRFCNWRRFENDGKTAPLVGDGTISPRLTDPTAQMARLYVWGSVVAANFADSFLDEIRVTTSYAAGTGKKKPPPSSQDESGERNRYNGRYRR